MKLSPASLITWAMVLAMLNAAGALVVLVIELWRDWQATS